MIINRSHWLWILSVLVATFVLTVIFLAAFHPGRLPFLFPGSVNPDAVPERQGSTGGTLLGILYGTAALLIFVVAALLGVRKKMKLWRIGRVELWLRAHIWLSTLTIPLVLFHCGFHLGGPMTKLLMALYAIVMVSGYYGVILQQFMPRLMMDRLAREVVYEEIPYLRKLLVAAAGKLGNELRQTETKSPLAGPTAQILTRETIAHEESRKGLCESLDRDVLPYLRAKKGSKLWLGKQQASDDLFRLLKLRMTEDLHAKVDEMQSWCDDRRQMDLQTKLHHWLHVWLIVHVPVSLLLLMLTLWHAVAALSFY